jgi:hypothetical protein
VLAFLAAPAWNIIAENLPALTDHVQLDPLEVKQVAGKRPVFMQLAESQPTALLQTSTSIWSSSFKDFTAKMPKS